MPVPRAKHFFGLFVTVAACAMIAAAFVWSRHETHLRIDAQTKLSDTLSINEALSSRISEAFAEREELRLRLKETEDRLIAMADRLVTLYRQIEDLKRSEYIARTDFKRIAREKDRLQTQLDGRDEHIQSLFRELADAKGGSEGVDLGSITVAPDAGSASSGSKPLEGEVVAVNDELQFLVFNLGQRHGISKGSLLTVMRDGRPVGTVEVELTQESLAAASLNRLSPAAKIRIGDRIRFKA